MNLGYGALQSEAVFRLVAIIDDSVADGSCRLPHSASVCADEYGLHCSVPERRVLEAYSLRRLKARNAAVQALRSSSSVARIL